MTVPVIIIGAGPAGIAAAVQLRRSGIEFLLVEKDRVGGLLNEANRVENFPGVSGGVPGRILAARLKRQLTTAGIRPKKARVAQLAFHDEYFELRTEQETFTAGKVILACGTMPLPPAPPLDPALLRGRLFTGVLPLLKASGETIAVIGGGDAAFDYALSMADKNTVHILVRSARPRALPILVERCRRHPGIKLHMNCRLAHAAFRAGDAGVRLETTDADSGHCAEISCQRILSAIGRAPALDFLDSGLRPMLTGLVRQKKLFLTGDAGNGLFRQAAIAAADGLRAAMEILAGGNACA
jgi:thioredoxin reductase